MDGRWKLWLAGGVLISMVGCSRPFARPKPPAPTAEPPLVSKSTDENKAPAKTETLLAWADVQLAAGRDANKSIGERDAALTNARRAYQSVLERDANHLGALAGLAKVCIEAGERERALETYRRAAAAHPQEAGVWFEMGVCCGQAQNWDGAIQAFSEASKLAPDNRTYRTWLGLTLARVGRLDQAMSCLRKGRSESEAHYLLAKVMLQSGREDTGKHYLALALRVDPNHIPSLELLSSLTPPTDAVAAPVQQARYEEPAVRRLSVPEPVVNRPIVTQPVLKSPEPVQPTPVPEALPPEPLPLNATPRQLPPPVLSSGWEK